MLHKKRQKGQSLTEYLILVALVAIASIGVVRLLGQTARVQLSNITNALQGSRARQIKAEEVRESHHSQKDLSNFMRNTSRRDD
jgi:Flp pilus assembly pilin Flp